MERPIARAYRNTVNFRCCSDLTMIFRDPLTSAVPRLVLSPSASPYRNITSTASVVSGGDPLFSLADPLSAFPSKLISMLTSWRRISPNISLGLVSNLEAYEKLGRGKYIAVVCATRPP